MSKKNNNVKGYFESDEEENDNESSINSDDDNSIGRGIGDEDEEDEDEGEGEVEDAAEEGDGDEDEEIGAQQSLIKSMIEGSDAINENPVDDDDESEDDDNINYLQKINNDVNRNYIIETHPECEIHNQTEIQMLSSIVRNDKNIIIDDLHRTLPFLTKFEKARILGQRAKQINSGSKPFIKAELYNDLMDGYKIAEIELRQKLIPFIIRRPLTNGSSEYWKVSDLENILF
jgi:DNA-directed RNA polymerase I, II, and III subunit RPABC2